MKKRFEMMQNPEEMSGRQTFGKFVKNHKKQIMIGTTATGLIIGIIIFKKKDSIKAIFTSKAVPTISDACDDFYFVSDPACSDNNVKISFEHVPGYIRTLPNGQKPSPGKLELAKRLNIQLGENQTLVNSFDRKRKIRKAA